jgi:WD40 repeat protein
VKRILALQNAGSVKLARAADLRAASGSPEPAADSKTSDARKVVATEGDKPTAFISYSRTDIEFVNRLEAALKARGVDARVDRDDIEKSEEWWTRIQQLIAEADSVIFVLSPASAISPICQNEVDFAEGVKKRLIPIVARDLVAQPAPPAIARLNWIFFTANPAVGASGDFDATCDDLMRALEINIEWIREHTRLGLLARRWEAHRRTHEMELRGEELSAAETWLTTRPKKAPDPTDIHRAYITESRRAATAEQETALANQKRIADAERQAREAAERIVREQEKAIVNLRDAQIAQSRFLADQARQKRMVGDAGTAVLLALEALPDVATGKARPYVPEAEVQLDGAWRILGERLVLGDGDSLYSAAFSPDGERIATASWNKTARIWDAATGKPIGEPLTGHEASVSSVVFSPDGKCILTASWDRTARIWDAATGNPIGQPLKGHENLVRSAAFSPSGKRIVTASYDKTARIWNATNGMPIGEPLRGHSSFVMSAAFSPDGKRIVTASEDNTARLWDAGSGKPIGEALKGHESTVNSAAFSPDGHRIATASHDGTARIWDAATGEPIGEPLKGHQSVLRSVAFSPDGQRLVTASDDATARIWDAATGEPIGEPLQGHDFTVWSGAFSPDGHRIVTASDDGTARIWDPATGKPIGELGEDHEDSVVSAAFSPDGQRIVTASMDGTARIWDAATGEPIGESLKGHEGFVESAAFQPRRQAHRHRVLGQDGAHLGRRHWQAGRRAAQGPLCLCI